MKYISIMGTQVMAVLNPLLALIENKRRPEGVHLLATNYARKKAEAVREFLVRNGLFTAKDILISDISSNLGTDAEGRPAAPAVIAEHRQTGGYFNIAGGMNFQIVACVQGLYDALDRFQLVYPERDKIHVMRIRSGVVHSHELLPLPCPLALLDILGLQGVGYKRAAVNEQGFLFQVLEGCGIAPPPHGAAMKIGPLFFDYVWNEAGGLKMIKTLTGKELAGDTAQEKTSSALNEVRNIIAFATSRDDSYELYHRDIAVLTDYPLVAERLRKEGDDKVNVLEKKEGNIGFLMSMRRFFGISGEPALTENPVTIKTGNGAVGNSVLYAVLGQDITATMIAIWSHRPKKVNLCYTPSDGQVASLKENITRHAALLPVSEVSFYPVGIDGREILTIPPPKEQEEMEVNISPGTKSQGIFLTLHALNRGGRVFSLKVNT